jgi:hypothetical protein
MAKLLLGRLASQGREEELLRLDYRIKGVLGWLVLLLLAACGPAPPSAPVATLPTAAPATAAPVLVSPSPTVAPMESPTTAAAAASPTVASETTAPPSPTATPEPSPTATSVPPTPPTELLDGTELLAWTVAADGAIYALDGGYTLHQLSPDDLAPLAQTSLPLEPDDGAAAYLSASEAQLFVGSATISQTLVLDRSDLALVARLDAFGPMALEPGHRLLMIPLGLEETWPFGNFEIWAYDLRDLDRPPDRVRQTGVSFDDLVVDAAGRRLYLLASNINASPPHRGQNYEVYDLDTLERIASFAWERGSLSRPAINPRTGEILGSRIGLNLTRRFLVLDQDGQEVRALPSMDGQPATDPSGEWIYLLRQRGLWLLREGDLSLQSVLPFVGTPPADLALSPDAETLYLLGNGWLAALSTAQLQELGFAPVSPLPTAWFADEAGEETVQPRLYPSPRMDEDGMAFVQLVGGVVYVQETYRTDDGGRSWILLPSLMEPGLTGARILSLSPDFSQDRTLIALSGSTLLRSTDGGLTWDPWQPPIAFTSERDGNREIYTMDLEGNAVQRLTDSPAAEENPAWSPTWTRLAFQSDRHDNWDIFTMRADCDAAATEVGDGCDLVQLTDDAADDLLPAWSPDGRSIAFVSTRDGNPEIYVMDSDGGNPRRLTFSPSGDWRPAWLPDSTHLVFVSDRGGNNDIYQLAVPAPGSAPPASEPELMPVIVDGADDRDPAVRLDGKMLFLSDRDGVMRTYTTIIGDRYSVPLPFAETDLPEAHPAGLPDDPYTIHGILVSAERDGVTNVYRVGYSGYSPLAPSPAFDGHPAAEATGWMPDPEAGLVWLREHEQ